VPTGPILQSEGIVVMDRQKRRRAKHSGSAEVDDYKQLFHFDEGSCTVSLNYKKHYMKYLYKYINAFIDEES
jgi:hypothetical protein